MSGGSDDPMRALATEVAGLRDLFQRRLVEDRDKRRLYEELYELVALARTELTRQVLAPVAREIVLMLDRMADAQQDGADSDEILESVRLEASEILARRGIQPITALGEPFDPRCHEACGQVGGPTADVGRVVREVRAGWTMESALLRPAQVLVGAPAPEHDHA